MTNEQKRQRIAELQNRLHDLHNQITPLRKELQQLELQFNRTWQEKDRLERELIKVKHIRPKNAPTRRTAHTAKDRKLNEKIKKLLGEVSPSQLENMLGDLLKEI